MFNAYFSDILFSRKRTLIQRNFNPKLFTTDAQQKQFAEEGFVHLKNVLTQDELNSLLSLYARISGKDTFEQTDYYVNTICFKDTDLRKEVVDNIYKHVPDILSRFMYTDLAQTPMSGGFCINPAHSRVGCRPHQDPTAVDELESYSMTVWISLNDMTTGNGCMHIIPGSHLWGNIHRSMSIKWALDDYTDYLQSIATPVPTKAGDIICFDNSVIHSSTNNQTDYTRLAINIPVFPKGYPMYNYFPHHALFYHNKADLYHIDEDYFLNESFYERPSSKYPLVKTVKLDNYYNEKNIEMLMQQYKTRSASRS